MCIISNSLPNGTISIIINYPKVVMNHDFGSQCMLLYIEKLT